MKFSSILMSRSTLLILEASIDPYDLGYHHAIRGKNPSPPENDKEEYEAGFESGSRHAHGLKKGGGGGQTRSAFRWHDLDDSPEALLFKKAAKRVVDKLNRSGRRVGELLGCGLNGCVYKSDNPGTVLKIEKGDDEARLARLAISNEHFGNMRILPKYSSVESSGVVDPHSGKELHIIEREDLLDLDPDDFDENWHGGADWGLEKFSASMAMIAQGASRGEAGQIERVLKELGLHDYGPGQLRGLLAQAFDKKTTDYIADSVEALVKSGIIPCDLHKDNWGKRPNGEIVMRDVGCYGAEQNQ